MDSDSWRYANVTFVPRPIAVEPRDGFRIWLEYDDGSSGEVDLSELAGKGVFKAWEDRAFFEAVHISDFDSISWEDDIDLCEYALYMQLTGKSIEEVMPKAAALLRNA